MRDAALGAALKEIDHLKAELAYLRSEFGLETRAPASFRLTKQENRAFGALYSRDWCPRGALLAAMRYGERDEALPSAVSVIINKIRKKSRPFGVEIVTIWGDGYAMTAASKAIVKAALVDDRG